MSSRTPGFSAVACIVLAACISGACLTVGCRAPGQKAGSVQLGGSLQPWPLFRADAANTGHVVLVGPASPKLKWESSALGDENMVPGFFDQETAPVVSRQGDCMLATPWSVFCIKPDGTFRWTRELSASLGPAGLCRLALLSDGTVVVPVIKHGSDFPLPIPSVNFLYALDRDGNVVWKRKVGLLHCAPVVDTQDRIYFCSSSVSDFKVEEFRLVVMSPEGHTLEEYPIKSKYGPGGRLKLALGEDANGVWLYCLDRGILHVVRPDGSTGQLAAFEDAGNNVGLAVSQKHDAVYVLMNLWSGILYRVGATSLEVEWRFELRGRSAAHLAMTPDRIYVGEADLPSSVRYPTEGNRNGLLELRHMLDALFHNGEYPTEGGRNEPLDHYHMLYALNHDGELLWEHEMPGEMTTAPAVDGAGNIYLTVFSEEDEGLYLYSLNPDGTQRWIYAIPESTKETAASWWYREAGEPVISSPAIGPDRTVYCYRTKVYAIGDALGSHRTDQQEPGS